MKLFKSIKWRLQLWYGLILVAVLAAFGFTAYKLETTAVQLEYARQLRQVARGLKMKPIATMPSLTLTHDRIKANTGVIEPAIEFAKHRKVLQKAVVKLEAALQRKRALSWRWPWRTFGKACPLAHSRNPDKGTA